VATNSQLQEAIGEVLIGLEQNVIDAVINNI